MCRLGRIFCRPTYLLSLMRGLLDDHPELIRHRRIQPGSSEHKVEIASMQIHKSQGLG